MASKFRNAGQTCVCANRILVQDGIHDAFVERLAVAIGDLRVGNGFERGVRAGPADLRRRRSTRCSATSPTQSRAAPGSSAAAAPHELGGTFFQPTLLTGATRGHARRAGGDVRPARAGLRLRRPRRRPSRWPTTPSSVWPPTSSPATSAASWRVGEALEFGVVGVNTGLISYEGAPFGGVKESGLGREGSRHGIDEFTEIKYLCVDGLG